MTGQYLAMSMSRSVWAPAGHSIGHVKRTADSYFFYFFGGQKKNQSHEGPQFLLQPEVDFW